MERKLFAGCGRGDITPEVGGQLYGYSSDEYSVGIHDRLDAKALALSDGVEQPVILVSVSVCEIATVLAAEICKVVADAAGTTAERVFLTAIHTHAAPNVAGLGNLWGSMDRPYIDKYFIPAITAAAKDAVASMQPAEYAIVKGESEIGVNRRERKLDGTVKLGQNPWGIQDKEMFIVRFRNSQTKEGIFQMVYYGCHGTSAGHALLVSRDFAGIMLDRLEQKYGMMSALWSGSIGDIGPRIPNGKTTGDIQMMQELGGFAAQEALRIAKNLKSAVYESGLPCIRSLPLEFDVRPMPSMEEIEAFLREYPDDVEKYPKTIALKVLYMSRCRERIQAGEKIPEKRTVPGAVFTLGDSLAMCFTPFELFSETTLLLRKHSKFRNTLGVSVTNGFEKYLPTQTEQVRGGYEVNNYRYADLPLPENADFLLLNMFLDTLKEMHTAYEPAV